MSSLVVLSIGYIVLILCLIFHDGGMKIWRRRNEIYLSLLAPKEITVTHY